MIDINKLCNFWASMINIYSSYDDFMDQSDTSNCKFNNDDHILAAIRYYNIFSDMQDVLRDIFPMNGANTIKETPNQELIDCEVRGVIIYSNLIAAWDAIPETTKFEITMIIGHNVREHFEGILKQFKYTMDTIHQAKLDFQNCALPTYNS